MNKKTKKRTLSMALAAALAFSPVQAFAASSDIAGHWAEDVITQWENAGMISGYEDGTFRPNNSVTRAEFVIMMNNALGLTEAGEVSFSDVQPGNWFYNAVAIAVAAGYCSGYEDGTFKPSATITRAEAAVMIANAAGLEQDATGAAGFTDSIPAWAQGSVGAVVKAGFMSGYPDGTFAANQSITRAEAVSSLNRVIGGVSANDVVVKEATEIADQTIDGNLIIDAALTDGKVTVKNTTVKGNIVVRGGAADALTLDGVTLNGKLIVEKEGAEVVLTGETKIPSVEISALSTLSEDNFKGSVGTITVTKNLDTDKTVKLSVAADKLVLDGTAAVDVNKDIKTVEITKDAEGSKVYVNKGATVDTVVADAKANVSGSGTVKVLEANANGITVGSSLTVNKTEVAEGVEKPTTSTSGGGGGGGGSSSSTDDDEVGQYSTFTVKDDDDWTKAVEAAATNKYGRLQIIIPADTKANLDNGKLVYNGTGNLIVDCQDSNALSSSKTFSIQADKAANVYLKDAGSSAKGGTNLTTLNLSAAKATVDCNWSATDIKVAAVSNATLNVKDEVTTVTIAKGSVNLQNGGKTAVVVDTVAPQTAGVVTVKGKMKSLSVNAAADVTIAGTVDGAQITSGSATKITVANGANVTGTWKTDATNATTYTIAGGTVENLTVPSSASGPIAVNGGTVKALALQSSTTSTATVTGGTVQTATVAAGKLTVDNGSVASVDFQGGTLDGKGTVDTVTAANGTTVGVQNVGTVKTDASATAVTINSTNVGMVETNNTSAATTLTLGTNTQIGTLVADKGAATLGANGTVNNIVATKKVTVDNAAQVTGSITVANGGTVVDSAGKAVDTVTKTEITDVKLADDSKVKRDYYKGEEIDLSGLTLTVTQTTTEPGGQASAATPKTVSYEEIKSLVTVKGFQKDTVGTYDDVTVNYAGFPVKLNGTFTVNLTQEDWANAAKDALSKNASINTTFQTGLEAEVDVKDKIELPKTLSFAEGTATVAWDSSDDTFVGVTTYGDDFLATVLKNVKNEQKSVTLTATLTSGSYTTSVVYTLKINAPNQGAMDAWRDDTNPALKVAGTTVAVDSEKVNLNDADSVKQAIIDYLTTKNVATAASGYTLDVVKVEKSGNNWNATLRLEVDAKDGIDYVENVVTFSVVDQAAGAKAGLEKVVAAMPTSIVVGSGKYQDKTAIEDAIKAKLQAVLGESSDYTVTVSGTVSEPNAEKKTSTWEGTVKVAHKESGTYPNDTVTSKDKYTVYVSEGMDITIDAIALAGKTNSFVTKTVTLRAGNTSFNPEKVKTGEVVTSWFTSLPAGLKATVKSVEPGNTVVKVDIEQDGTNKITATAETPLTVEIPAEYLVNSEKLTATNENATIEITQGQEDVIISKVPAKDGNDYVSITLTKDGAKFDTVEGVKAANYTFNNKAFTNIPKVSPDHRTVTIELDKELEEDTKYEIGLKAAVFTEDAVVEAKDVDVKYYTSQKDVDVKVTTTTETESVIVTLPEGQKFVDAVTTGTIGDYFAFDQTVSATKAEFVDAETKNAVKLTVSGADAAEHTLTIKAAALDTVEETVTAQKVTVKAQAAASADASVTSTAYTVASATEVGATNGLIAGKQGNTFTTSTSVDDFVANITLADADGAEMAVVNSGKVASVNNKATLKENKATGNLKDGDVLVVVAEDDKTIAKYDIALGSLSTEIASGVNTKDVLVLSATGGTFTSDSLSDNILVLQDGAKKTFTAGTGGAASLNLTMDSAFSADSKVTIILKSGALSSVTGVTAEAKTAITVTPTVAYSVALGNQAEPVLTVTAGTGFTGTAEWVYYDSSEQTATQLETGKTYQIKVTLTPGAGYIFKDSVAKDDITLTLNDESSSPVGSAAVVESAQSNLGAAPTVTPEGNLVFYISDASFTIS